MKKQNAICGAAGEAEHDWDGCVCRRCGKTRDTEHNWDGCKCRRCGQIRDEGHNWVDTSETEYVATSFESGNQYGDYFPVRKCTRCGERYDWQRDIWGY